MTKDGLSQFVLKATRQQIIKNRSDVEIMAVALASLFKGEVLTGYMEETQTLIDKMDGPDLFKGPTRDKGKLSKSMKRKKVQDSMNKLMPLTAVMQGTWQPPE